MLEKKGQLKAFRILSASGLVTPATVTISLEASRGATERSKTIAALVLDAVYPESISKYTGQLSRAAVQLADAGEDAKSLADAISPHCTPSELMQLKIGWEYHAKGHGITPPPPFALAEGMGKTSTPEALLNTVNRLLVDDVTAAMRAINAKISAAAPPPDSAADTAPPIVTDSEVNTLKRAVETISAGLKELNAAADAVAELAKKINDSTALARAGMENAVAIALSDALLKDSAMLPAISLIMPTGVIAAIQEDED